MRNSDPAELPAKVIHVIRFQDAAADAAAVFALAIGFPQQPGPDLEHCARKAKSEDSTPRDHAHTL